MIAAYVDLKLMWMLMFEIFVFLNIAIILLSIKFYMLRYLIFDDHRYNSDDTADFCSYHSHLQHSYLK